MIAQRKICTISFGEFLCVARAREVWGKGYYRNNCLASPPKWAEPQGGVPRGTRHYSKSGIFDKVGSSAIVNILRSQGAGRKAYLGVGDVVIPALEKRLSKFKVKLSLDGLVIYGTKSSDQEIEYTRFLNNVLVSGQKAGIYKIEKQQ